MGDLKNCEICIHRWVCYARYDLETAMDKFPSRMALNDEDITEGYAFLAKHCMYYKDNRGLNLPPDCEPEVRKW